MLRLNDILDRVATYHPDPDLDLIKKAYVYSAKVHQGQIRKSGEPYLVHPLEVAGLLAEMKLDESSVVTGLLEMIPVAGPIASAVIAAIVAFEVADGTSEVIAFVIYAAVLRLSIDQIVGPLVLGRAGRIHPVLVIFCFLAGGLLFGVAGVIMAVPVALTVRATLATVYREPRRRQRWRVDDG